MYKCFGFLKPIDTFASCISGMQTVNSPIKANRYSKVGFLIISAVKLHSPNPHKPEINENAPSQKNILLILFSKKIIKSDIMARNTPAAS